MNIPNPITIAFDPAKLEGAMHTLWTDDVARKLWLAWRCRHIVSQYFIFDCWNAAQRLRACDPPITEDDLRNSLRGSDFGPLDIDRWVPDAIRFFNGEEKLEWVFSKNVKA